MLVCVCLHADPGLGEGLFDGYRCKTGVAVNAGFRVALDSGFGARFF